MSTFEAIIYEVNMQKINCNLRFFENFYLPQVASSCSLGEKNIGISLHMYVPIYYVYYYYIV